MASGLCPHASVCGGGSGWRTWRPNRKHFMPRISMLVDAFLEATGAKVVEVDVACCWSDKGAFADVISHLDNLAQCLPPSAAPHTLCWSRHLG